MSPDASAELATRPAGLAGPNLVSSDSGPAKSGAACRDVASAGSAAPEPDGQGYSAVPNVITQLTGLTVLMLREGCFDMLPELYLGRHSPYKSVSGGSLDVRALGSLSAFPRLFTLHLDSSAVILGAECASAATRTQFRCLVSGDAHATVGPSSMAVLAYAAGAKEQGRWDALLVEPEHVYPQRKLERVQAALEAVGCTLQTSFWARRILARRRALRVRSWWMWVGRERGAGN